MSLALVNLVREVLSQPEVAKIDFALGGMMITPSTYRMVKEKILVGHIDVVLDSTLNTKVKDAVAKYSVKENKLKLGDHFLNPQWSMGLQALIIHECTHAAADLSALTVQIGLDEAAAHVAQMLYMYYRMDVFVKKGLLQETPKFLTSVHREAWKVAALARSKKMLSDKDIRKLLRVISEGAYRNVYSKAQPYDG